MDEIGTNQGRWLHTLQSMSKRPLRVSKNFNGKPSKWVSLEDAELPVDYRTILHNEIVIDIDSERWKEVRMFTEIITDTLNKMNVPYITAYTGGRGVHIHVFFDLSEDQKNQCNRIDVMPKDLRVWLFHYILKNAGVSPTLIGPGNPFDTSCVNWSDEGKGHLVRIFGGKKRQYKTLVTEIPERRPKADDVAFPDDIKVWKIPERLFCEFIDHFKNSQKERVEAYKRYEKASQNFTGKYLNLPCVKRILEGLPEGKRNAGAQIVAIACRLDSIPEKEAEKVILDYAGNCPQENISESEYSGWINWIYTKEPFWNCRFCKELGLCEENCQFNEAAFKDVLDFLKDPNLIKRIDKILGKKIKKDRKNRMLVFFVCLSAYGSNPLNLFLKGESSIGKTHIAKSVAEYFPEEDVWFIGDMSPKALIHERGTFENSKVYISLENKILVFLETPRKETLEMLKPILSHDRKEIEYKIADKKVSGQLGTKSVIIQGWPATIFCTTDHRYLEELSTRSMVATPEVTKEKIAEVLEYKGEKYARPWETQQVDEEEVIFRKALHQLKSVGTAIPYGKELARKYNGDNGNLPRVMRDYDKLMGLIEMSTFLHQSQRVSVLIPVNDNVQEFCIGNEDDLLVGFTLFESVRETTITGLPQPVLDFYENVVLPIEGEVTYHSLIDEYTKYYKRTISQVHIKYKFVDPLVSTGYLFRDRHPVDGRKKIFEKRVSAEEMKKKTKEYQAFVLKDIFSEDELKEYMNGIKNILQKNGENEGFGDFAGNGNSWFYTNGNLYNFLEEDNCIKKDINDEDNLKIQSCLNLGNLDGIEATCEVEENQLIDQYDEETVLQQIPEEDTKVEDVLNKFKYQNKAVDTIVVLQEKGKVIAGFIDGQSYMRRLSSTPRKKDPDVNNPGLNTWTCGKCGIKFQAQIPYEDYDGHAICEDCWNNLGEGMK
ncbi:MAG: hypothetical protein HXS48_26885 [Theionarchaea archaeon]|nr:hypothetical protein [Theionarchaea archaeon]